MCVCVSLCVHGEQTSGGAGASDVDVADVDVAWDGIVGEVFKLSDPLFIDGTRAQSGLGRPLTSGQARSFLLCC